RGKKLEAISKPHLAMQGHSERSEESRIFNNLRSFTAFRMTEKMSFAIASNQPSRTASKTQRTAGRKLVRRFVINMTFKIRGITPLS
ncbi:MAG: hypothetical protein ABIG94_10110, partial [Pseudomonadota bacterium]